MAVGARAASTLAIVVHYGNPVLTRAAVEAILRGDVRPGAITVVDNGPAPLIDVVIERTTRVLRPGVNLGFAKAVNLAARSADSPEATLIWLVNNDAIVRRDAFAHLLGAMDRAADHALISSRILDLTTGEVWFERARFYPWRLESRHERLLKRSAGDAPDHLQMSPKAVAYLPGCSLLIPASLLASLGGLDESFFLYGEDVDLSVRASRLGFQLILAEESLVDHLASSGTSARDRERMHAEVALRLTARYFPWMVPSAVVGGTAYGLKRAWIHREPWRLSQRWAGYRDALMAILRNGHKLKSPWSAP